MIEQNNPNIVDGFGNSVRADENGVAIIAPKAATLNGQPIQAGAPVHGADDYAAVPNLALGDGPGGASILFDSDTPGSITLQDGSGSIIDMPANGDIDVTVATAFKINGVPVGASSNVGVAITIGMASSEYSNDASWDNYTVYFCMPACRIFALPANTWKFVCAFTAGTGVHIDKCNIVRTLRNSLAVVDRTPVKFGGNMPATIIFTGVPTVAAPELHESDAISLALDHLHDYYIEMYFDNDGVYNATVGFATGGAKSPCLLAGSQVVGDTTAANPIAAMLDEETLITQVYVAS